MDSAEYLFFQLLFADAVRAAGPAVLVCRTDIVDVLLCLRWNGFADHGLLAVSAEQEAGKQMNFLLIGGTAHIALHHCLDCHEVFVRDESFMSVLNLDPFLFILFLNNTDFVVGSAALALSQNADVNLVGQNPLYCVVGPLSCVSGFEDGIVLHTG